MPCGSCSSSALCPPPHGGVVLCGITSPMMFASDSTRRETATSWKMECGQSVHLTEENGGMRHLNYNFHDDISNLFLLAVSTFLESWGQKLFFPILSSISSCSHNEKRHGISTEETWSASQFYFIPLPKW